VSMSRDGHVERHRVQGEGGAAFTRGRVLVSMLFSSTTLTKSLARTRFPSSRINTGAEFSIKAYTVI